MNDYFRDQKKSFEMKDNSKEISIEPNNCAEEDVKAKIQPRNFPNMQALLYPNFLRNTEKLFTWQTLRDYVFQQIVA